MMSLTRRPPGSSARGRRHRVRVVVATLLLSLFVVVAWCASVAVAESRSSSWSTPPTAVGSSSSSSSDDIVTVARSTAAATRHRRAATALSLTEDANPAHAPAVTVDPAVLECPVGWARLTDSAAARTSYHCVRLVSAPAAFIVTPIRTGETCAQAWTLFPPEAPDAHTATGELAQRDGWYYNYTNAVVSAASVHSSYENEQLRAYVAQQPISNDTRFTTTDAIALGGVAGFGQVDWFDGSVDDDTAGGSGPYANFDSTTPWLTSSNCMAMHPSSGLWFFVGCRETYYPYVCRFTLDQLVTASAANGDDGSDNATRPTTTTTTAPSKANVATRPPVPTPVPTCLDGWVPLPASVSSSHADITSAQDGAMCYRLFAPAGSGVGLYGLPKDKAEAYCATFHPTATLANVLSAEENEWVLWQVIRANAAYPDLVEAASTAFRTVAVFLGGTFSLNGTIGLWSGDVYAYNGTSVGDDGVFSSPAWPTPANAYYTNWGEAQPRSDYGCLGMKIRAENEALATEGTWVSQSCGVMQPFLCSYRNDGSTFANDGSEKNTTTTTTTTTRAPEKGDVVCRPGWSQLGANCYRVLRDDVTETVAGRAADETDNATADEAITPAILEERCHAAIYRRGSSKRNNAVHASAIRTVEESMYVGSLLAQAHGNWTADGASSVVADVRKALIGVSFLQKGNGGGLYLNGRYVLAPTLAHELWASRQPTLTNGCVAVDEAGWWYAVPCDTVSYRAYVCEYYAPSVDPNPANDGDSEGDDDSSATTSTLPPAEKAPLAERVVSLAGAVHLVVSAGTTGVYAVEARDRHGELSTASAAQTDGLLFLFSPVSPYYYMDLRDSTAVGLDPAKQLLQPFQTALQGPLLFNVTTYAPCGMWKEQSRVFAVQQGHVTVRHGNQSEVGYVCVSEDGHHYVPTRLTYEVVEAQVDGFVQIRTRSNASGLLPDGTSSTSWLPPLFYTPAEMAQAVRNASLGINVETTLSIERFSSGVLQVVGGVQRRYAALPSASGAAGTTDDTSKAVVASVLRSVRFASSPACLASDFYFVNATLEVREVSGDYTHTGANASQPVQVYALVYSAADTAPNSLGAVQRLSDAAEAPPVEYYVCVAVEKRAPTSLPWLDMYVQSNRSATAEDAAVVAAEALNTFYNASAVTTGAVAQKVARDRLLGTGSRTRANTTTLVYTTVPGLKVLVTPPQVSVSGMWVLPPQPSAAPRVGLTRVKATTSRPAHDELFEVSADDSDATTAVSEPIPSATEVHVGQYSSPIIALDGEGLRQGMSVLLSRDPSWCNRVQPSAANMSGTSSSVSNVPASLDTMLAISTVNVVRRGGGDDSEAAVRALAFVQLSTNHTGMWGFNVTDPTQSSLTWYVCYAYSPMTSYVPLRTLRIVVDRLQIRALTASRGGGVVPTAAPMSATAHLTLNTGFAGLLHVWGLDVRYWASNTLQTAQIALAEVLPSSHLDDATYQCANPSLFYQQTGLHLVPPSSRGAGHILASSATNQSTSLVLSPGFLSRESTGPMRVCLSVPQPFQASRRVFTPVSATVNVRPVELMYVGRYGAATTPGSHTVIQIAEDADELFFPLIGYGVHADVVPFLSTQPCRSQSSLTERVENTVQRQSVVNLTIVAPYDIPQNYQNTSASSTGASESSASSSGGVVAEDAVYLLISKDTLTSQARAAALYGPAATRVPLSLCLYIPETDGEVYATGFQVLVKPPEVRRIRNLAQDADLLREAMRNQSFPAVVNGSSSANDTAIVVYAAYMDLLVDGFGLETSAPEMVPAVDCANASSFLWADPVTLSAMPAATGLVFAESERYVDRQTSTSSWYLSLAQRQTTRIGAVEVNASDLVTRFQWCVRFTTRVNASALLANPSAGFEATAIPYQLVIPPVDGFRFGDAIATYTQVPTQDKVLGQWQRFLLAGPLVDVTYRMGNALYLFITPEAISCTAIADAHLRNSTVDDSVLLVVDGELVILPSLLTVQGRYKFCASAIHPSFASLDDSVESGLQLFELGDLRLEVRDPVYAVFSLNHTRHVTVEQGQEWALPIRGSHLSNHSLIRFVRLGQSCSTPMPSNEPDIAIKNQFPSFHPFGDTTADVVVSPSGPVNQSFYVSLEWKLLYSLDAPADYRLCVKPNRATDWMASTILLTVLEIVRKRPQHSYFAADGSDDVVAMNALAPTKLALPGITGEADTVNIVGALGRQVSIALWCRDGSRKVPCGTNRRVMFAKPMDDDSDPCFVDTNAIYSDFYRGPYVIDDGVLTLPHDLSAVAMEFYPNMTQPWILCQEIDRERWREPIAPLFQLQYTDIVLSGFRARADNASNSTALFPETLTMSAEEQAARKAALGLDRSGAEGNQTLLLHAGDSSQVYYLNGYGVQRGQRIRFGHRCTANLSQSELDAHDGNVTAATVAIQGVNNTLWFDTPLLVEDDLGTVLFPQTHLVKEEPQALPMCLSIDDGRTYRQTKLALQVLPSELIRDLPVSDSDAIRALLADTIVVPLGSHGEVTISAMTASLSAAFNATATLKEAADSLNRSGVILPVGTQVVLSSSCAYNVEQLPLVTVAHLDNHLTLTVNHTRVATHNRLRLCVRVPLGGPYTDDEDTKNENEGPWWEDDDEFEQDNRVPLTGYVDSGLYLRVLNLRLESISVHPWLRDDAVVTSGLENVLVRRQFESIALSLDVRRGESKAATPLAGNATSAESLSLSEQRKDEMLRLLDDPDALVLFALAQLRLGDGAGLCHAVGEAAQVTTFDRVRAAFSGSTLTVGSSDGRNALHLVSYLPMPDANESRSSFEPWAPGSLCLSVDGGRHFVEVGVGYVTADWAPTLRVHVEGTAEQETNMSALAATQFSGTLALYEQTSVYAVFTDTRYDARFGVPTGSGGVGAALNESGSVLSTAASAYLSRFTVESLWVGFLNHTGFASQGELYMPAIRLADLVSAEEGMDANSSGSEKPETWLRAEAIGTSADAPLTFSSCTRWPAQPTGVQLRIDPVHLTCLGSEAFPLTEAFVRRVDSGLLLSVPHSCGFGLQDGVAVRLVKAGAVSEAAVLCDEPAVEKAYVFNAHVMWPRAWAAVEKSVDATEDDDARGVYLHFPTDLAYVPDGSYRLCIKKTLSYEAAQRAQRAAVYLATPVRVTVESGEKVHRIAGLDSGLLAVPQGSNARLTLEGSAVGLPFVPLLVAFATVEPLALAEANATATFTQGCADVPRMRSPITGVTTLNTTALAAAAPEAAVLSAPWLAASVDGQVEIPAGFLRHLTASTLLYVCYSVDYGLTFRTVGAGSVGSQASKGGEPLLLAVMPPAVTGLAVNASAMGATSAGLYTSPTSRFGFNASHMTPSVLRVQRFAPVNETNHTMALSAADAQPASIYAPTRPSMNDPAVSVIAGLPNYYYAPTGAVIGNGLGLNSGRTWWSSARNATTLNPRAQLSTPTFAAAVALVRSSVAGQSCSALPAANATNATLALPIFLLRLDTGRVWTSADDAALAATTTQLADTQAVETMNPVLQNEVWRNSTANLLVDAAGDGERDGQTAIRFDTVLGRAAANVTGESLLVCLSVDGARFYSANAALPAPVRQVLMTSVSGAQDAPDVLLNRLAAVDPASTRVALPLSQWPSTPVWVRPDSSSSGSLLMRDAVVHMQIMVRPNLTALASAAPDVAEAFVKGDPTAVNRLVLDESAAALARLQAVLSDEIGTEPSILSIYLTRTGSVVVPTGATTTTTSTTTTTTTTSTAPANGTAAVASEVDAVARRVEAFGDMAQINQTLAEAESAAGLPLPIYVLTVGVTTDAYYMNETSKTRTLMASPDLLLRVVSALRSNVTQFVVLESLLSPATSAYAATLNVSSSARAFYVSAVSMNVTLGTGEDLHAVNRTDPSRLPSTPAQEKAWRTAFLSIPFATLTAVPIPDAPDNDTGSKAGWWVIPLLLVFPILIGVGTYYVYTRHLRMNNEAGAATDTTVTS